MKQIGWFFLALGLLIGFFFAVAGVLFAPGVDSKAVAIILGISVCFFAWLGVNTRADASNPAAQRRVASR